ncbi:MAG: phosphoribosylformylglycinamidine synthase I [Caldilineales bacterium]|nr:phosphoribosylformylglycinamidine synthase I [Caldilineales bacterium]
MTSPPIAILHAPGTNRDTDAAIALEMAGGATEIVHINQLLAGERRLRDYAMLVLPGGFSYGDDLGAGKLWAVRLLHDLGAPLHEFADSGKPIIGICNGFQVLVKAGMLPGVLPEVGSQRSEAAMQHATLTRNASAHFECRWVYLEPNPANRSPWLSGLDRIHCPVAHGEGNFRMRDEASLQALRDANLTAFTYVDASGDPGGYPVNPNGSVVDIAGITSAAGNILGLMPHPEDHILPLQHPARDGGARGQTGLKLFQNGVAFARQA